MPGMIEDLAEFARIERFGHKYVLKRGSYEGPAQASCTCGGWQGEFAAWNDHVEQAVVQAVLDSVLSLGRVDEVAKAWYENPRIGFSRGWEGAPDDVKQEYRSDVVCVLTALKETL